LHYICAPGALQRAVPKKLGKYRLVPGGTAMTPHQLRLASRRRFLQFLAASPLFAHGALAQGLRPSDPMDWAPRELDKLIEDPTKALDVFDFEAVCAPTATDSRNSSCGRGGWSMSARST
jgi:hypothetical protein